MKLEPFDPNLETFPTQQIYEGDLDLLQRIKMWNEYFRAKLKLEFRRGSHKYDGEPMIAIRRIYPGIGE